MSTKSTIAHTSGIHFYYDVIDRTFCIQVDNGIIESNDKTNDTLEVAQDSEFANLMRYLLKGKTQEELEAAARGEL